jgi:hypothetical protein
VGGSGAIAGAAAVDGTGAAVSAATGRVKSRLLSRTVGSAAGALTTARFGLVFASVDPVTAPESTAIPARSTDFKHRS